MTREKSVEDYVRGIGQREVGGLERGGAAELLRKVTTARARETAKLWGTRALRPWSRRAARQMAAGCTNLQLHLGSGRHRIDGWINVDILGLSPDILWDLRDGIPFPDNSAEAVFLEHVLEHFALEDVLVVLRDCRRVLRPGGVIRVGLPDFGKYIQSYTGDRSFIESERPGRPTPLLAVAEVALLHGHRSVWDAQTLDLVLSQAGFDDVRGCHWGESVLTPAPDLLHRQGESVYAEAVRPR